MRDGPLRQRGGEERHLARGRRRRPGCARRRARSRRRASGRPRRARRRAARSGRGCAGAGDRAHGRARQRRSARRPAAPASAGRGRDRRSSWATRRPRPPSSVFEHVGHLGGQLARRHEHQRLHVRRRGSMRSSSGRPKAMVLPEPVRDWPMTSRPASSGGMARAWMSVGVSIPTRASARDGAAVSAKGGEGGLLRIEYARRGRRTIRRGNGRTGIRTRNSGRRHALFLPGERQCRRAMRGPARQQFVISRIGYASHKKSPPSHPGAADLYTRPTGKTHSHGSFVGPGHGINLSHPVAHTLQRTQYTIGCMVMSKWVGRYEHGPARHRTGSGSARTSRHRFACYTRVAHSGIWRDGGAIG